VAWQRRGSGPATARAGGALPSDSGGRRGRRDVEAMADRWAGTRRGAQSSVAGRDARQRGEVVGATLTGGAGSTVRPIRFSNRIKFISNGFEVSPNFTNKTSDSLDPKIPNKIWIERA
jgi:hypothetical protein